MKKYPLFLLLIMFCFSASANEATEWQNVYLQVKNTYINNIDISQIAISALKNINSLDDKIQIGNDLSRLTLYHKGKVIKIANKPMDNNDALAWGKITSDFTTAAILASQKLEEKSFLLTDALAQGIIKTLDKDSEFYSGIDEANGIIPHNRRHYGYHLQKNNLYVQISAFNKQTYQDTINAINQYPQAQKLIIDLRNCLGGMAGEAIKIADLFLDSGIIASSTNKNSQKQTYYNADEYEIFAGKPIEILTSPQTASAAEIFTAALKEQSRAKIIGNKTFGKGSMQQLIILPSGSVLAVTSGYFQTPSGKELNNFGIDPDIKTSNFDAYQL